MHEHKAKAGDLVLICDCVAKTFAPKYKENFRIVKFLGKNQLQVKQTMTGKLHAAQLQLNPANIPNFDWKLPIDVNALTFQAKEQVRNCIRASNFQVLPALSILAGILLFSLFFKFTH